MAGKSRAMVKIEVVSRGLITRHRDQPDEFPEAYNTIKWVKLQDHWGNQQQLA
jgi:hypothetical protein